MENDQEQPITESTAKKLVNLLSKTPLDEAAVKSFEIAKKPVGRIRSSQILTAVFGFVGITIFSLGVQNFITSTLNINSPAVEIVLGLILLSISGLLLKKLI